MANTMSKPLPILIAVLNGTFIAEVVDFDLTVEAKDLKSLEKEFKRAFTHHLREAQSKGITLEELRGDAPSHVKQAYQIAIDLAWNTQENGESPASQARMYPGDFSKEWPMVA